MQRNLRRIRGYRLAQSIEELRVLAHRRVPYFAMEYVENGSEDEKTLARNRDVFDAVRLAPYTLADVSTRDTAITLFGRKLAAPLLVAPTGFNGMLRRGADVMLARAAARAGIVSCSSAFANERIEEIAAASQKLGGDVWFQLYILKTRSITEALLERAQRAGVTVLQVTTDAVVFGAREWDRRNFGGPTSLTWRAKLDAALHPSWMLDVMIPHGAPKFANLTEYIAAAEGATASVGTHFITHQVDQSLTWEDLKWLRARWPGRIVLKGVLRTDDVLRARDCGADGVVLSNHGGRQLEGCVSGVEVLPVARRALGPDYPLLVDGGFRRGVEVLKAIALGATAALVGRATLYGVAAAGEEGALHALEILKTQIHRSLGQLGLQRIDQVDAGLLHPETWLPARE